MSIRTLLEDLLTTYECWMAESDGRLTAAATLLDHARVRFDESRALSRDRLPWCTSCGERLDVTDDVGVGARDGVHRRCYGG